MEPPASVPLRPAGSNPARQSVKAPASVPPRPTSSNPARQSVKASAVIQVDQRQTAAKAKHKQVIDLNDDEPMDVDDEPEILPSPPAKRRTVAASSSDPPRGPSPVKRRAVAASSSGPSHGPPPATTRPSAAANSSLTKPAVANASASGSNANKKKKGKGKGKGKEKNKVPVILGGRNKFKEIMDPRMPPCIPLWAQAVENINLDRSRPSPEVAKMLKNTGYLFPEPGTFIALGKLSLGKKYRFYVNWLAQRSVWTYSMFSLKVKPKAASNQDWRTFLGRVFRVAPTSLAAREVRGEVQGEVGVDDEHDEVEDGEAEDGVDDVDGNNSRRTISNEHRISRLRTLLGDDAPLGNTPDVVVWRGNSIPTLNEESAKEAITINVSMEILWELHELNFRFELLALDRHLRPDLWDAEDEGVHRDADIQDVFFGDGGYLVGDIPTKSSGLAAVSWRERLPYVRALRNLMADWPFDENILQDLAAFESKLRDPKPGVSDAAASNGAMMAEGYVVATYCQKFFDTFGRPPICPHRIPPHMET